MLPSDLAKSNTEHAHQRAFFQWLNLAARFGFGAAIRICDGRLDLKDARQREYANTRPELNLMHAIPNGGMRQKSEAAKLKAEGVKAGVLDTFLPVPKPYSYPDLHEEGLWHTAAYNGLYVEFKEPKRRNHKNGGLSDAQVEFCDGVREQGYCVRAAYTWRDAANLVMAYYLVDNRIDTP